jgi:hypothetical protein
MSDSQPDVVEAPGVARRRFLTRGAIAAAVAAGGAAVLTSEPAGAADNSNIMIGSANNANNTGTTTTKLTGSQFWGFNGNGGISIVGESTAANAVGVEARSADGPQLRLPPNSVNPADALDGHTYDEGSLLADSTNQLLWYTWEGGTGPSAGNFPLNGFGGFVPLDKPSRQYDSRAGQPQNPNVPPINNVKGALNGVPFGERTVWVANTSAVAIVAVLLNVTVVNTSGQGFLAVRAADVAWDNNAPFSNMNWFQSGQITANAVVSALDPDGQVKVRVGSPPPVGGTDFILDLLGAWVYP